jgi:lysophospholipase L1-like esterase
VGGTTSTGGSSATGRNSATGGSSATGGNSSTGGRSGTGGSTAAGGSTATGGSAGTGGEGGTSSGGTSGKTGTGGATDTGGVGANDGGIKKDATGLTEVGSDAIVANEVHPPADMGNGSDGGGTDASSYAPCPANGNPCKILPLGDSITWGIQYDGAYRVELFSKAVAAGQNITFTGSLSNGPTTVSGKPFPKKNEGHSGWTIDQDASLIPSPAVDTSSGGIPNIILLMIGTNDVYASSGQSTMSNRLGTLLDKIIDAAPDALLVVAKITPLTIGNYTATIKTYNDAIPGLVQKRAAAGKHVILADMNTGFNTSTMMSTDGVHPNQTGYNFMGDQWYSVIGSLLPK